MAEIVWTAEAAACLREIHDHVAADNSAAASRVVKGITSCVEQLTLFPDSGASVDLAEMLGLRMLL